MANETDIRPAFTPQFWPLVLEEIARNGNSWGATLVNTVGFKEERRHEAAALALYGQPFGFTHEMVVHLRLHANAQRSAGLDMNAHDLEAIADRIAALLPPHA